MTDYLRRERQADMSQLGLHEKAVWFFSGGCYETDRQETEREFLEPYTTKMGKHCKAQARDVENSIREFYKEHHTLPRQHALRRLYGYGRCTVSRVYNGLCDEGVLGTIDKQYTVKDLSFFE